MSFQEWLALGVRWAHVIAAIAWIGSSFYFIWLDQHLERVTAQAQDPELEGSLWMVHSGGFYRVERRKIGPGRMPKTLHWFKWEAAITWASGIALLILVYYTTHGLFLVDPAVYPLAPWIGVLIGVASLVLGRLAYQVVWAQLGERQPTAAILVSLALLAGTVFLLCARLSGRAAFLHVGAILGTIMVSNVWDRILPAQQRMIDATGRGETPDFAEAGRAKMHSVINSYLTFPVLFLMLSSHWPGTYGGPNRALVALLLIGIGMGARHLMIGHSPRRWWWAAPMAAGAAALAILTAPARLEGGPAGGPTAETQAALRGEGAAPEFAEVEAVVTARCIACHATAPRVASFGAAPGGVNFEKPGEIVRLASRIKERAVITETMPLSNWTLMTPSERLVLARWIGHGAKGR